MMSYIIVALAILKTFAVDPLEDKTVFPDWGDYTFNTYSGYIPIGQGLRYMINNILDNYIMYFWKVRVIHQQIQLYYG